VRPVDVIELLLNQVQRMRDLIAVEQREYRASEAERFVIAARCAADERCQQGRGCSRVVEEDAPVGVADQYALRQLRHQGCEAVTFFLDARPGLGAALIEIVLDALVGVGQLVDAEATSARSGASAAATETALAASRLRDCSAVACCERIGETAVCRMLATQQDCRPNDSGPDSLAARGWSHSGMPDKLVAGCEHADAGVSGPLHARIIESFFEQLLIVATSSCVKRAVM
jgi:hypothetical protein